MIRATIAFLASILTAVQAFTIYLSGQAICFNNGCAIVDSLTSVPPLFFNIAGFVYFQILFWCLLWGRDGSEHWHKFARLLLLAGLGIEAVLVFFQYAIVEVFCSYCLIILSAIVLLNILCGPRQIFRGVIIYSAVTLGLFALQFRTAAGSGASLDSGSIAKLTGDSGKPSLYLFFSSTCPHCEKVIELLQQENSCTVHFNPIERLPVFSFPGAELFAEYTHGANLNFLNSLAIKEIPVVAAMDGETTVILRGGQRIREYLEGNCRQAGAEEYGGSSEVIPAPSFPIPGAADASDSDTCSVEESCAVETPAEAPAKP